MPYLIALLHVRLTHHVTAAAAAVLLLQQPACAVQAVA
jgi:hypothetical protein